VTTTSTGTQRFVYLITIRAGTQDDYVRAHEDMPAELKELYREVGFRVYSLFMAGTQVIAYCESDGDPSVCFEAVADHPLERGFEASLAHSIVELPTLHGVPVRVPEVWRLD
jgi:L-rhamnose mutarotase